MGIFKMYGISEMGFLIARAADNNKRIIKKAGEDFFMDRASIAKAKGIRPIKDANSP